MLDTIDDIGDDPAAAEAYENAADKICGELTDIRKAFNKTPSTNTCGVVVQISSGAAVTERVEDFEDDPNLRFSKDPQPSINSSPRVGRDLRRSLRTSISSTKIIQVEEQIKAQTNGAEAEAEGCLSSHRMSFLFLRCCSLFPKKEPAGSA